MNPKTYQQKIQKFFPQNLTKDEMIDNFLFGLLGELGEISEHFKHFWWHKDHPLDMAKISLELGDCFWYLAALCHLLEIPFGDVVKLAYENADTVEGDFKQRITKEMFSAGSALGVIFVYAKSNGPKTVKLSIMAKFLYPLMIICLTCGLNFNDILKQNIAKLTERWGEGGFQSK